jgi:hypothetical protein
MKGIRMVDVRDRVRVTIRAGAKNIETKECD